MLPALRKVGPRPGCLRSAFSSGRTGRLGRESGSGGRRGGARKFCPRGWRESASLHRRRCASLRGLHRPSGGRVQPAPRPHLLLRLSRWEGSSGAFFLVPRTGAGSSRAGGRGRGCRVLTAVGSWPPPRSGWWVEARKGLSRPLPWGSPYELRPLPARLPGARARGLNATRCPGPVLLKSLLPRVGVGRGSRARSFSPPLRLLFRWRRLGLHGRRESHRGHCFQDAREQRGAHARRLPPPPGLAGAPAAAAGGAHVGCRALTRRLGPGRIPSLSHSPGMWGCDCYSTFRRRVSALPLALRLALSPAWPRGMPPGRSADVTTMLCTSSPPPSPPTFTLPLWSPLVARERRMRGWMPRFLSVGPSSTPPPSPPPLAVCVQQLRPCELMLEVQRWGWKLNRR